VVFYFSIFVIEIYRNIPRPPRCRTAGLYFCKFQKRKYIFVKNKNKKQRNHLPSPGLRARVDWPEENPRNALFLFYIF